MTLLLQSPSQLSRILLNQVSGITMTTLIITNLASISMCRPTKICEMLVLKLKGLSNYQRGKCHKADCLPSSIMLINRAPWITSYKCGSEGIRYVSHWRLSAPYNLIKTFYALWFLWTRSRFGVIFQRTNRSIYSLLYITPLSTYVSWVLLAFIDCCRNTLEMMEKHSITSDKFSSPTVAV